MAKALLPSPSPASTFSLVLINEGFSKIKVFIEIFLAFMPASSFPSEATKKSKVLVVSFILESIEPLWIAFTDNANPLAILSNWFI